ncbi:hypothetical protein RvY_02409 [Ramazzottius varieornatus]|uniref:Uncharacterized protein n=1 Tax=Ramazzottius varieornatus TaxID=947166 RepID=A0A1D1UND0_RAMVA|nr:hypothetical protein RvY_02409 [Ramazzottius varieornatus]
MPLDMASFKLHTASQVGKQLSMDDAVRAVKEGGMTANSAPQKGPSLSKKAAAQKR